ncbi:MAG: hypothetical protein DMF39_09495 [Verrucomicrobia bacterium]|nr:MAG: hypothetical protein DMF39_09495 [Verrucomicrobiota bacterium]
MLMCLNHIARCIENASHSIAQHLLVRPILQRARRPAFAFPCDVILAIEFRPQPVLVFRRCVAFR